MSTTSPTYPIPTLTPATRAELDLEAADLLGLDFEGLVAHCQRSDEQARAQGGRRGWRPNGPSTLALRVALDVALAPRHAERAAAN